MEPVSNTVNNNERLSGQSFQLEELHFDRTKSKSSLNDSEHLSVSDPSKLNQKQIEISDGDDEFSSSDDSEIEYQKKVTRTRSPNHLTKDKRRKQEIIRNGISDDNLGFPDPNYTKVTRPDVIFSIIVLLTSFGNFVTDFGLIWWHYSDDLKWVSSFTCIIMIFGAGGMLNHYSHVDTDTLNRLFLNGHRVKFWTSCFPFLGSVISSYQYVQTGFRARKEQIFSLQFFGVEDFSLNLLRIQSLFQSAPQATFQLVVLMETVNEISSAKGIFSITAVVLSLAVMTISNLPYKNQNSETMVIPAAYGVKKRVFIACRMFSSFGSRAMAIAYLLMGLGCILGRGSFASILLGIMLMFVPRLIFTFVDFTKQLLRTRRSRNSQEFQSLSCCGTFVGYFATIFIPMSDPLWIFWFVWAETALYILFGNIIGWSTNDCISNTVNAFYTGTFIVVFLVIPIIIPFARATARRKQIKRMELFFDEKNDGSATISPNSSISSPDIP